ncbi:MAG: heat-inducible transcriptional repressor HrcA [Elusimicrobiota bacterium]
MRHLDPKTAEERKRKILKWAVDHYIKTSRPIASSVVAEAADLDLSSATIRSVLKELEDEGYLAQLHASSGRVPTDRGYRFYVDYIHYVQRLASDEKERIERQYQSRVEELDRLLAQTSRLLSHVSHGAGLVLSPPMGKQTLKRLELLCLGGSQLLAIIITNAGQVRHWPIRLSFVPSAQRIHMLNRFLNDHVQGRSIQEVQAVLASQVERAERELRDLHAFAKDLLKELETAVEPEELYLEGATTVVAQPEEFADLHDMQRLASMLEERKALTGVLQEQFREETRGVRARDGSPVRVLIGQENALPELKNLSLVTTTYRLKDRVVGVLGVLGSKRMEYSRMMSLVDYMGEMVSRTLEGWDGEEQGTRKTLR